MSARTQKGYIWREGNVWLLRYRDSVVQDGGLKRKQLTHNLGPVAAEHARLKRPPETVLEDAKQFLAKLNSSNYDPERNVTLPDFVQHICLPHKENRLAASTVHSHRYYWQHLLKPRWLKFMLRDFSTPEGQKLLDQVARQNTEMKKATLHKLKSMLSAIFRLAIAQGYRPGPNPIRETALPRAPEGDDTFAYDLETILAMLRLVPEPSRTVLAIAGFAGLRRGEIEGLLWESYGETLKVSRAMWQGVAGEPKSKKSRASVPVIAPLRKLLDQHRARCGNPETGIMFQTRNGTPLSMNNLLNDQILPAIEKCSECHGSKELHGKADHKYRSDSTLPEWHGFHAFRRGLATNLHELGVDDLTIQRILRHSDVSVTQRCYIKTLPQQTIDAMAKVELAISRKTGDLGDAFLLMCSERAGDVLASKLVH